MVCYVTWLSACHVSSSVLSDLAVSSAFGALSSLPVVLLGWGSGEISAQFS